ncbi:MAG: hypothetical protein JW885_03130 [Deltaproteobacteria bacterium]|nr:hypothetical protein [Candidatus Zymogenaceae bacterium]
MSDHTKDGDNVIPNVKTASHEESGRNSRRRRVRGGFVFLLSFLLCVGCAVTTMIVTDGGTFTSERYRFTLTIPEDDFERVSASDTILTLTDRGTGVSMMIRASKDRYAHMDEPPTLEYIARHLFFYVEDKVIESLTSATLAGESGGVPAVFIRLRGTFEETPLVFFASVSRYGGYVYDLVLWSPPRYAEESRSVFEAVVDGFMFLDGR